MDTSIITNALKWFDGNTEKYMNIVRNTHYYDVKYVDNDEDRSILTLYDKNDKVILRSKIEIAGLHFKNEKIWFWGWSMPNMPKNMVYINRKLMNYSLDSSDITIRHILLTSRLQVENNDLDYILSLASYITKIPFIIPLPHYEKSGSKKKKSDMKGDNNKLIFTYYVFVLDYQIISG